jgi:hypothetical protein
MALPDKALDLPDDAPWAPGSIRTPISDLGEAAARLGSPAVYDRRGQVIWMDDFSYGLSVWVVNNAGATKTANLVNANGYRSGYALSLNVNSVANDYIFIDRKFIASEVTHAGMEVCFLWGSPGYRFYISMARHYKGVDYSAAVYLDNTAHSIYIETPSGNVNIITGLPTLTGGVSDPHIIKLVVDWATNKYVRMMIDEVEYDISAYAVTQTGEPIENFIHIQIAAFTDGVNIEHVWINHCIITSNEP